MKITTNHAASSYGLPVILDKNGTLLDYPEGLTQALTTLEWSRNQFAVRAGYKSSRSIEKWWQALPPSAKGLNVLKEALESQQS